ncbi:MAG TPA: methyltransferase domain-containing protein, partial [Opitutaceae bacterium]|nr:methyltransferase domain-containing protein [Opitutaceae bacterium]
MTLVPIINTDQASAWDGDEGSYWVVNESRYERMLAPYTVSLLQAAQLREPDHVLDVGCGCGGSTRAAAWQVPRGSALGVDLSRAMLARARQRATEESLLNVRFEQADAQVGAFPTGVYDAVISRFGVMFFSDPLQAFKNLRRSLKVGGTLTAIVWQGLEHNAWIRDLRKVLAAGRTLPTPPSGTPGPLGLADPDYTRHILSSAGFGQTTFSPTYSPLFYGETTDAAFAFICGMPLVETLLEPLSKSEREKTLGVLRAFV